jgi:hypothetical protein
VHEDILTVWIKFFKKIELTLPPLIVGEMAFYPVTFFCPFLSIIRKIYPNFSLFSRKVSVTTQFWKTEKGARPGELYSG